MMTSTNTACEEVAQDLPRPRITFPRPSEMPHTSPSIDVMLVQAQEHRARCERLLEALGAPVCQGAVNTSSKES